MTTTTQTGTITLPAAELRAHRYRQRINRNEI